ncbi:hypothetical protein VaNZ11_004499 [Volvox africanus]|uniref:Uncharacterized protein n=1 Tax=Volvox africanus TaxID=51714 RepID=A0ABQ5RXB4_9CHLO|nr:hypothetical protein VaNZ11_004499 [Volvox africanus]
MGYRLRFDGCVDAPRPANLPPTGGLFSQSCMCTRALVNVRRYYSRQTRPTPAHMLPLQTDQHASLAAVGAPGKSSAADQRPPYRNQGPQLQMDRAHSQAAHTDAAAVSTVSAVDRWIVQREGLGVELRIMAVAASSRRSAPRLLARMQRAADGIETPASRADEATHMGRRALAPLPPCYRQPVPCCLHKHHRIHRL